MRTRYFAAAALFAAWMWPLALRAQSPSCQFRGAPAALAERPSPLDSVRVDLGGQEAKLCYGRPAARGRAMVGGRLPYGTPWEMGANEPTTLHLPFPARVGSVDLAPGSYSLYAIPAQGDWTIVVNANPDRWGVPISASVRAADVGSFAVTPQVRARHVETLTFSFEDSGGDRGALVYEWERLTFSIPIMLR